MGRCPVHFYGQCTTSDEVRGLSQHCSEMNKETGEQEWMIWMIRTILKDFVEGPSINFHEPVKGIQTSDVASTNPRAEINGGGVNGHMHNPGMQQSSCYQSQPTSPSFPQTPTSTS